jgi:hypothetical protein
MESLAESSTFQSSCSPAPAEHLLGETFTLVSCAEPRTSRDMQHFAAISNRKRKLLEITVSYRKQRVEPISNRKKIAVQIALSPSRQTLAPSAFSMPPVFCGSREIALKLPPLTRRSVSAIFIRYGSRKQQKWPALRTTGIIAAKSAETSET